MTIHVRKLLLPIFIGLTSFGVGRQSLPSFSIAISGPQVIKVGSPAKIVILVTNQSRRTILYSMDAPGRGERNFIVDVHDSFGNPVTKTQYFKAVSREDQGSGPQIVVLGKVLEFSFKPGANVKDSASLSELFDFRPGNYTVRLSRDEGYHTIVVPNPSEERRTAQQSSVIATSNTVAFSVVP